MKSELRSRHQLIILILILLFHALFLIALFMIQQHYDALEIAPFKKEPVILIEDQVQKKEEQANVIKDFQPVERDWVSIASSDQPALQQDIQEFEEQVLQDSEQPTQELEESPPVISQESITEALSIAQQVLGTYDTTLISNDSSPSQEKIPDIIETIQIKPDRTKEQVQQSKPNLTFAQLAQGFVKHVEQSAAIQVESSKNGVANVEQIKHLNYIKKIVDCIENSFVINTAYIPANRSIKSIAHIQLMVNQNGSIHTLNIIQSSGNSEVDRFLLHVFKDASSSFPPIPPALKENPYRFPIFVFDPQIRNERKLVIRCH